MKCALNWMVFTGVHGWYAHLLLGQPELTGLETSEYGVVASLGPSLKSESSHNGALESRPTFGE